jgi:hypothetical protein
MKDVAVNLSFNRHEGEFRANLSALPFPTLFNSKLSTETFHLHLHRSVLFLDRPLHPFEKTLSSSRVFEILRQRRISEDPHGASRGFSCQARDDLSLHDLEISPDPLDNKKHASLPTSSENTTVKGVLWLGCLSFRTLRGKAHQQSALNNDTLFGR